MFPFTKYFTAMLLTIVLSLTIAAYLFSFINFFWLKIKVPLKFFRVLKVVHFVLLPLFLFPIIFYWYREYPIHYLGRYTNFIVFWGFLITGFLLAGFLPKPIKNQILTFYLSFLKYIWVVLLLGAFINPYRFFGQIMILNELGKQPERIIYDSQKFRIEEERTGKIMSPQHLKIYSLFQKKGIFETENSIRLFSEVKGMPTVTEANVMQLSADTVLVTMTFKEDILLDGDSVSKSITQKVKLN